jgi:polar amino acid transport system ATP-binding protein
MRTKENRPMIEIQDLSKSFGVNKVLQNISLDVASGEAVVVIGPSGSGKTTLLRCINLLEEFEEGLIWVDGDPIGYVVNPKGRRVRRSEREIADSRSHIGIVFQSFNLFPHMTVLKNITAAPVRVKGVPLPEAERRARELLERVGLEDKADEYPIRLSGGQQQRVAIARALAMQPKVMLFDEVTSALDPELVGEVLEAMRQLIKDGLTMVIVTHEMQFARDVAHRIVFMDSGSIIEQGPPAELFENPGTDRLRTYLKRYRDAYLL